MVKTIKKLMLLIFLAITLGLILSGCGRDNLDKFDEKYTIDENINLEIVNIEPHISSYGRVETKVTYKLDIPKDIKGRFGLTIVEGDYFDKIQNEEVSRFNSKDKGQYGETIYNEDGTMTAYMETNSFKVGKYKCFVTFNLFEKNEKIALTEYEVTQELSDSFVLAKSEKAESDKVALKETIEKNKEIDKSNEESVAVEVRDERLPYEKTVINEHTDQYKIYLYKDEEIHLTGDSSGYMNITLGDGNSTMDSYFHDGKGSFDTWLGDEDIKVYADSYYFLTIDYNNVTATGYNINWNIH